MNLPERSDGRELAFAQAEVVSGGLSDGYVLSRMLSWIPWQAV